MKKTLLIVTDLGTFKAFTLDRDPLESKPRLEMVDGFETLRIHDKLSEQLADKAGQFSKGSTSFAAINDMANGERHNLELENRRRTAKEIADAIAGLMSAGRYESCYFAAPKEINQKILELLPESARGVIEKNLGLNLVNVKRGDLLAYFENPSRE